MLTRIATAVVLIPIVLVLILRAPVPVVAVVAAVVALLTILEFLKLTESYGVQPLRMPTYIFVGVIFSCCWLVNASGTRRHCFRLDNFCVLPWRFAAAIAPFLFLTVAMRRGDLRSGYPAAAASVFAFAYIALPMGMLVQLREWPREHSILLYLAAGSLGGRHLRVFRRQVGGAASDGAAHQSEKNLGGRRGFAGRQRRRGMSAVSPRSADQFGSAAYGLIQRSGGMFGLEQPATWGP